MNTEESSLHGANFLKLIFKFQNNFKPNSFVLYVATILKLLGLVLLTHSLDIIISDNKYYSITDFIAKITMCNKNNIASYLNEIHYGCICFCLYVIIPVPCIILYIIHRFQKRINYKSTKVSKIFLKISSILNGFILLFSQHIIEVLSLVILYIVKPPSFLLQNNQSTIILKDKRSPMLILNIKYFYLVMNCIYIIILNIYTFFQISLLNQPFFSANVTIQIYQNKWFQIILCLIFNCQGISLTQVFYPNNSLLKLIIACILAGVLFIYYCSYGNSFFSEQTILSRIFIIIINMCFFSCFLEIYVYKKKLTGMSVTEFIEKILIELIFGIIINVYLSHALQKKLKYNMSKMLFAQHKNNIIIEPYLYFATILMKSVNDNSQIYDLLLMIQEHKKACKEQSCKCNKSSFRLRYERLSNVKTEIKSTLSIDEFFIVYKDIIICFENEISKLLDALTKMNKLVSYSQVLLLQIEYICFFSQNVFFSCFLIEKYLRKIRHPPFMLQYQMYQLKHKAIQSYKKQLHENLYRYGKSHSKEMMTFSQFFKYQQIIWSIRINLNKATCEYLNVFSLKHMKYSIVPNSSNNQCNIEVIIKHCNKYNNSSRRLRQSITRNFSIHTKLNNEELCYLITIYYLTICREMPKCIQKCINVEYNSVSLIQSKHQSYSEKGMNHPIIVFVEEGKQFIIRYMCKYLMTMLGYDRNELIGREINILLPKEFDDDHLAVISNTILKKKPKYFEDKVFCIDKKGYYIPVKLSVGFFPTIDNNIIVIINFVPQDYSFNDSFIIMDEYGTFLTYSKTFEKNFIINREIINKVKLNFFNFFNLNEGTLDPFKKILNEITVSEQKNNIAKSIIQRETMIKFTKKGEKIYNKLKEVNEISIIYDKQRLKTCLDKIKNWIKESQTDLSLLYRINQHETAFELFHSTSNFKDNNISMLSKFKKQLMVMQIKISSMNNSPFYYVKIYDIEHSSQDFIKKSMNNCSVISSNINRKDDSVIAHVKTWIKPSIKPSNIAMPLSPTRPRRNSLIKKLLNNPSQFGAGQPNNNLNNSSLLNLNNTNTNQSLVQFQGKLHTLGKNKEQFIKGNTAKNRVSIAFNNNHINSTKGKFNSTNQTFNDYIKTFTLSSNGSLFTSNQFDCQNIFIFKIIMTVGLLLLLFLSIFFYPLISDIIDQIELYSLLGHSNMVLQYLLTSSSLLTINSCLIFPNKDPSTIQLITSQEIKMKLKRKSLEFLEYLNVFHSAINNLNAYHLINLSNNTYSIIKQDWNIYNRQSTLIDELLSYHFYLDSASRQDKGITQCHIEAFKFKQFNTKPITFPFEINNDDMLLYYILENVIIKIVPDLVEVYSLILIEQLYHFNTLKMIFITYTVCFLIFLLMVVIFLIVLFALFIRNNLDMTGKLISEKNDAIIVTRLMMFKVVIEEFDYDKCEEYERVMKDNAARVKNDTFIGASEIVSVLQNPMFGMNYANNQMNNNNEINAKMFMPQQSFNNNNKLNPNQHMISNYNHSTNDYMNDIGGLGALNIGKEHPEMIGQHPQLVHNQKKKDNNTITNDNNNNNNGSTQDNQLQTEENLIKILHKNNQTVFFLRIFILIFIIVSIGLLLIFLFINLDKSYLLQKSNSIISSHINVMNCYNYLTLFYLSNVLYFNPYPIPLYDPTYQLYIQDNWYNIKPDINNTITFDFKDTMYSAVLYLLEISEGNVNTFNSIDNSLLKELNTINKLFNSNEFCYVSSLGYNQIILIGINPTNYFNVLSQGAQRCRLIGNGLNQKGFPTALQTYLLELNSLYRDFISDYERNERSRFDDYFYMTKQALFDSVVNILFSGDKMQFILSFIAKNEVIRMIAAWRKIELYFILGFISFDMIFIGVTLWLLIKFKWNYNILLKIANVISTSLRCNS